MRVPGHQRKLYTWRWTAALAGLAVLSFALVMAIVVTPASKVEAATFTVNLVDDDSDADVGDGVCDIDLVTTGNQCTLRAAIEQANETSGVTDTITFNITGVGPHTILVGATELDAIEDDHLTINGGAETIIIKPDVPVGWGELLRIDADDVTIRNLILDGDDEDVIAIFMLTNNDEATISSVDIMDFDADGIVFVANNDDNVVDDVYVHDLTDVSLAGMGVILDPGCDDNIIRNSTIEDNGDTGIWVSDGSGNQILNNTIEDNGNAADENGILAFEQSDFTISGNTLSDNYDNQIWIGGPNTGVVTIKNNSIDVDSDGIELDDTCECDDVTISGSSDAEANCFSGSLGTNEYYLENMSTDDVDAEHNYWAGDDDPDEEDICATNADNTDDCDGGPDDALAEVDWNPVASSCAGPATTTPTASVTPTQTLTPTPGTPTATPTRTRTATPLATATPTTSPMESVSLVGGACNPVVSTYPDGTAIATIAGAVSPSGILISIWWYDAGSNRWLGYSPQAPQASDLTSVDRLEVIFICVSSAGSWSRYKV